MATDEMKTQIEKRYFDWLYEIVCGKWEPRNLSFHSLLTFLYDKQFVPDNEMDCNRAVDGENLRDRFLDQQNDISAKDMRAVTETFLHKPCSMLEMMVALALRCEETIMEDADAGNRTGQWFWNMLSKLLMQISLTQKGQPDQRRSILRPWQRTHKTKLLQLWS